MRLCLGYAFYAAFGQVIREFVVQLADVDLPAGLQICVRITRTYRMNKAHVTYLEHCIPRI